MTQVDLLPTFRSTRVRLTVKTPCSDQLCSICLNNNKKTQVILPCGHIFHYRCALNWMFKTDTCPLCRNLIRLPMDRNLAVQVIIHNWRRYLVNKQHYLEKSRPVVIIQKMVRGWLTRNLYEYRRFVMDTFLCEVCGKTDETCLCEQLLFETCACRTPLYCLRCRQCACLCECAGAFEPLTF